MRTKTYYFETSAEGMQLTVQATPYTIATKETRYRISYNNGPVHIFAWDENRNQYVAIKEGIERLSHKIEFAISNELQSRENKKAA
jgi:ribosome-associated translation inhibitor RaiA